MDLISLFPNNQACLLVDNPDKRTKVWRIANVDPFDTNRLRVWLLEELVSMAFNLVIFHENETVVEDERLAHRIGLLSVSVDPLDFEDFDPNDDCTELTCVRFDCEVVNNTREDMKVTDAFLRWVPFGNQVERLKGKEPYMTYGNLLLLILAPGQSVSFSAFAMRGTGKQHAKFASVYPISAPYIKAINRRIPAVAIEQNVGTVNPDNADCPPCSKLAEVNQSEQSKGFSCVNFSIQLQKGLTWENIFEQFQLLFDWGENPPRNTLEQPTIPYLQI